MINVSIAIYTNVNDPKKKMKDEPLVITYFSPSVKVYSKGYTRGGYFSPVMFQEEYGKTSLLSITICTCMYFNFFLSFTVLTISLQGY